MATPNGPRGYLRRFGGIALILLGLGLYLLTRNSSVSYQICGHGLSDIDACEITTADRIAEFGSFLARFGWVWLILIGLVSAISSYSGVHKFLSRFWKNPSILKNGLAGVVSGIIGFAVVAIMTSRVAEFAVNVFPLPLQIYGSLDVPSKVSRGTTAPVTVRFDVRDGSDLSSLPFSGSSDPKHVQFFLPRNFPKIEVELLGAGTDVDRERKQVQTVTNSTLVYAWNCFFRELGEYNLTVRMQASNTSGEVLMIAEKSFPVSVRNVFGLPVSDVELLAGIASIVGTVILFRPELEKALAWLKDRRRKRGKMGLPTG
jgi:hypothetical protein